MSSRLPNRELWVKIFEELDIDPVRPVSYVSAEEVRRISNREARNMAYMDERAKVPDVFRKNSLFMLPVSNGRYAIVRGEGYHTLEATATQAEVYRPPFLPDTILLEPAKSEGSAISYALNTGLISHVTGVSPLFLGAPGRFYLDEFSFDVNGTAHLTQKGAQAEIDGFFFGREGAMVMEFKAHECEDFLVRQLYYPYRHWSGRASRYHWKSVRPFFVDFDARTLTYRFFEYEFGTPTDYESIRLRQARLVRVVPEERPLRGLLDGAPDVSLSKLTPQADRLDRVLRVPFLILRGAQDAALVAEVEGFTIRQSSYYRRAAELLGLVHREGGAYALTDTGRQFVRLGEPERNELAVRRIARIPAFHEIFDALSDARGSTLDRNKIGVILARHDSRIHGSTVPRRVSTVIAWLRWVGASTGILSVDAMGAVRSRPRMVIE